MKFFVSLFHFLGGLSFALFLIAIAACWVIAGTFLESYYDSHLYAAQWSYSHPAFGLLLSCFFINILFSALRRWPFKLRHVPFLITHLGLLMIISGTLIKNFMGVQGNLHLTEGTGGQLLSLPHSQAIGIQKRDSLAYVEYPITKKHFIAPVHPDLPELKLQAVGYHPHVSESFLTWTKGKRISLIGIPSFPVHVWHKGDPYPEAIPITINENELWDCIALSTSDPDDAIKKGFLLDLKISITTKGKNQDQHESFLEETLLTPATLKEKALISTLALSNDDPHLSIEWNNELIKIPLHGNSALLPILEKSSFVTKSSLNVDLIRKRPLLLIVEDPEGNNWLYAFDAHGRVEGQYFSNKKLASLIAFDEGFAGYGVQAQIPYNPITRTEKETALLQLLSKQLRNAFTTSEGLAPPLKLLKNACQKTENDFTDSFVDLLLLWDKSNLSLIEEDELLNPSLKKVLAALEWNDGELKACQWIATLFSRLENSKDPLVYLEENHWPYVDNLRISHQQGSDLLTVFAQQIFSLSSQFPDNPKPTGSPQKLLSAYLKAYGLQLHQLIPPTLEIDNHQPLILETFLKPKYQKELSLNKLENNRPGLMVKVVKGNSTQIMPLMYDPEKRNLAWPLFDGEYKIRYQPKHFEIPHRIRLREARQINFADSQQPYSYECDLIVTEKGKDPIDVTLSMNRVFETKDGYRIYLAGIGTSESGLKQVHLVVNYDPAKYFVTYPGGILVSAGIILLFWLRPYKKN